MAQESLVRRARTLAPPGGRALLGITGPPGAGKTTMAEALRERLGAAAAYVPMDGFHLADVELDRLGRRDRKGAPDTFDAAGYVALLRRLRENTDEVVYAPAFERDLEQPIAGSIPVPRSAPLIITEGNYLLLDDPPWRAVRDLLDEVWFVDADEATRVDRLVRRHVRFGKSPPAARAWVRRVDLRNAATILAGRERADLVVTSPMAPRDPEEEEVIAE
ncbi:nucleoside/nucleotide kinase family protein [Actinoallomurus iriomotensis]|uniref:Nucleoside/nucleotide kinase family protein n=1 Tax=Actinoallomurus iriomotensis TaxID=478107 RepID=A0A9W6RD12_9ACTN|nr:nucleoside/nucleotide kinase family protein [Actinoallomurus iriomotensis]GLY73756.1 nucleoside/nucleotide kinase family protein [Actinoallomurus iriomotensis]